MRRVRKMGTGNVERGPAGVLRSRGGAVRGMWMGAVAVLLALAVVGCDEPFFVDDGPPAAPRNLDASYFGGAVRITWELGPGWDGDTFRVFGKRVSDADFFLIAEVTNCSAGFCSYDDSNVVEGVSYEYYVASVHPDTGEETASQNSIVVDVPFADPPAVPNGPWVVALDNANFFTWEGNARDAADFSFYRIYLEDGNDDLLLGETDSEGFLDLLAQNGQTYVYRVAAVDNQGHESSLSVGAEGTPRPDYHGEWVYADQDQPGRSGFRFGEFDDVDPILSGGDPARHFRLEVDAQGWWLVPAPGTEIHAQGFVTTALKCGVAADLDCSSLDVAPTSGYTTSDVSVFDQTTYPMRVVGDDGQVHYGVIRISLLGEDQNGDGIMIFDWAYQLQPGNANLEPRGQAFVR